MGEPNHVFVSRELVETIDGLLLGDGHINKKSLSSARIVIGQHATLHHGDHRPWVHSLQGQLATLGLDSSLNSIRGRQNLTIRGLPAKEGDKVVLTTRAYCELLPQHKRWYRPASTEKWGAGKRRWIKRLPNDLQLTPSVLALWFMGDGSNTAGRRGSRDIRLATDDFSPDEVEALVGHLLRDLNLRMYRTSDNEIRTNRSREIDSLLDVVCPYVNPCFQYKMRRPTNG